jgi:hypothetical protein
MLLAPKLGASPLPFRSEAWPDSARGIAFTSSPARRRRTAPAPRPPAQHRGGEVGCRLTDQERVLAGCRWLLRAPLSGLARGVDEARCGGIARRPLPAILTDSQHSRYPQASPSGTRGALRYGVFF